MTVSPEFENVVRKFRTTGRGFCVRFHDLDQVPDINQLLHDGLDRLLDTAFEDAGPNDRVGVEVNHPNLGFPILVPFRARQQLNTDTILRHVEQVQQSKRDVTIDDEMVLLILFYSFKQKNFQN